MTSHDIIRHSCIVIMAHQLLYSILVKGSVVRVIMVRGARGRDSHIVQGAAEYCMVYRDHAPSTIIAHSAHLPCFN